MRVTHYILNWRRPKHVQRIVRAIQDQSEESLVVVIDNASNSEYRYEGPCDIYIERKNENACYERWLLAKLCQTEYLIVHDDDLVYAAPRIVETALEYLDKHKSVQAVGAYGVGDHRRYRKTQVSNAFCEVEILKGRWIMMRASALDNLDTEPELYCDDIKVSSILRKKIVLPFLSRCMENLPEGQHALSLNDPDWMAKRQAAAVRYFNAKNSNN